MKATVDHEELLESVKREYLAGAMDPNRELRKDEIPSIIHNIYFGKLCASISPFEKSEIIRLLLYNDTAYRMKYVPEEKTTVNLRTIIRRKPGEKATSVEKVTLPSGGIKIYRKGNTLSLREQVYRRDGKKCLACGTETHLTIDHVIPKSKGGCNSIDNLQTLCKPCNFEKGDRIRDYRNEVQKTNDLY